MSMLVRTGAKIGAIVAMMTMGMPLVFIVAFGSWLPRSIEFLQPLFTLIALGVLVWVLVEVARRVGVPRDDDAADASPTIARFDEADLRLVLDSKDAIGDLRTLAEGLQDAPPATQLLGLAAVADGLLNALPQAPQLLDAARPLLVFYLPRVVAAAERLPAPGEAAHDQAADRLAHASALLGNALRSGAGADIGKLDQAVQALNVSFGKAPAKAAAAR